MIQSLAGNAMGGGSGKDKDPGAFLGSKATPLYSPLTGLLAQLSEIQVRQPPLKQVILEPEAASTSAPSSVEHRAQGPMAILNRLRVRIMEPRAKKGPGYIARSIERHAASANACRTDRRRTLGPVELTADTKASLRDHGDLADVQVKWRPHARATVLGSLKAANSTCTMAVARTDVAIDPAQRYNVSLEAGSNLSNSTRLSVEAYKGRVDTDGQCTASHASTDLSGRDLAFGLSHSRKLNDDSTIEARYFSEALTHTAELLVRTSHDLGRGRTLAPQCTVGFYYGKVYDSNFELQYTCPTSTAEVLQVMRTVRDFARAKRTAPKKETHGAPAGAPAAATSSGANSTSTASSAAAAATAAKDEKKAEATTTLAAADLAMMSSSTASPSLGWHSPFPAIFGGGGRRDTLMPKGNAGEFVSAFDDGHVHSASGSLEVRALVSARGAMSLRLGLRIGEKDAQEGGWQWRPSGISRAIVSPILLM